VPLKVIPEAVERSEYRMLKSNRSTKEYIDGDEELFLKLARSELL
jgi:hypothetical protein